MANTNGGIEAESHGPKSEQRRTFSDFVYHKLFNQISSGELPKNSKLPSEFELAEMYDVSRPVVRQALQKLRDDGLIYSQRGSGSFVQISVDQPATGLDPIGSIADIQRCYEFRISIESDCAYFAALRHDSSALGEIMDAKAELEKGAASVDYYDSADFSFHHAVAKATNNKYYFQLIRSMEDYITISMRIGGTCLVGPHPSLSEVLEEHENIVRAIVDRNPDQAKIAMKRHIDNARVRVFEGKLLDLSL